MTTCGQWRRVRRREQKLKGEDGAPYLRGLQFPASPAGATDGRGFTTDWGARVPNGTSLAHAIGYVPCVCVDAWEMSRCTPTLSPLKAQPMLAAKRVHSAVKSCSMYRAESTRNLGVQDGEQKGSWGTDLGPLVKGQGELFRVCQPEKSVPTLKVASSGKYEPCNVIWGTAWFRKRSPCSL